MHRLNWLFLGMLTGCLDFGPPPAALDPLDQAGDGMPVDMQRMDARGMLDSTVSDGVTPDMVTPDMVTPDMVTPDMVTPDMVTSDMVTPDMVTPDMVTPDMVTPDMATPDMGPSMEPVPAVPDFIGEGSLAGWTWLDPPGAQHTIEDGALIMEPDGGGWHQDGRGLFLYTTITGDFVIETTVHAGGRDGMQAPSTPYNVAGLLARSPAGGPENWALEAVGFQTDALGTEGKFTVNDVTRRNEVESAVSGRLRICRQGDQFTLLHWLDGENAWQVFRLGGIPTQRPDLMGEVQVGVFAGGWMNSTIRARFEQIRLGRPATCDGVIR